MNKKFGDHLAHTTQGTDWDQTKRKYIAKIDGRYFYTPEQLRAYGQRAGRAVQGLGIRAKNNVAAVRNKFSRAVASRGSSGGNSVAVSGYNKAATKNAVKARASATRSNVVSAFDKIRSTKLGTSVSKKIKSVKTRGQMAATKARYNINGATYQGRKLRANARAAWKKVSSSAKTRGKMAATKARYNINGVTYQGRKLRANAINAWNSIRDRASQLKKKAKRKVVRSGQGVVIRAKNDVAAAKNKAKRTANKVTSSVKNAVSSRWNEFKTGYQNGKKKNRPKGHERVVSGSAKVEKKGSGLNLGGPVGGKTPGSGLNNKKKKK